jgi:hypothetical protein
MKSELHCGCMTDRRRFPPPSTADDTHARFTVREANGQALAYVYFDDEIRSTRLD